ncbi:hypothetical protein ASE16_17375 [Leifsonia sp. Root227]|uniref:hypothetical protein n=1 Tax=unclassified Leifsonia TaxID=2663824 RepID=UPI00070191EC|nr:hypothetical protein [Leifsonia sp. Root227]KRC47118.1 hypothetical protein ASE16_17375 [Leifsonia sp. Root227]
MTTTANQVRQYGWVRHLLPRIVIGALIAAALVGVYAVVIGRFDETCWRLIGTIALLVFFSLVSWYDADVSARRAAWFGVVSVITSAYLLMAGLAKIWVPVAVNPDDPFAHGPWWEPFAWIALVIVTRLGLLHIHLVLNTQRRFTGPVMSKVTVATLLLVALLTLGLSVPLALPSVDFGETYWRLMAVVAILDALGTILIPLTYTLFGPKRERPQPWPPQQPGAFAQPTAPQPAPPTATQAPQTAFAAVPAASQVPTATPPTAAYPRLDVAGGLRLEWPRYISGQPLPVTSDGSPDFTGVVGY